MQDQCTREVLGFSFIVSFIVISPSKPSQGAEETVSKALTVSVMTRVQISSTYVKTRDRA